MRAVRAHGDHAHRRSSRAGRQPPVRAVTGRTATAGAGGSVPDAASVRRPLVGCCSQHSVYVRAVYGWACGELGGSVSSSGAGLGTRGRLGWCGVWWLFQGCCSGGCLGRSAPTDWGEGGFRNVPNYAYTQDGQELGASAGACRAGSLAGARFRPLSAPPRTLVCTSA